MRALKDSNNAWLGYIPSDWKTNRIGSIYVVRNQKVSDFDYQPLSVTMQGIVPQLESAAKTNAHDDRKLVRKGDFAINSRSDRRGSCGISPLDGSISLINTVLCPLTNMNPNFYNWLFHTSQFADEFYRWGHGITDDLWTTAWQEMKNIIIPIPPLDEQKKISDFLDKKMMSVDSVVKAISEEIESINQYLKSKVNEIFDLFLSKYPYKLSKISHLSTLVTKQTGFDYTNTIQPSLVGELTDDTIPYLQTRHFKDNQFNFETEYYIPKNVAKFFPNIVLNKKCLLFSIVGASIGNVAVYPGNQIAFLGGAICKVDLKDENLLEYVKHCMMSPFGQNQILININSSAQGTITVQNVRDFRVPIFNDYDIHLKMTNCLNDIYAKCRRIISKKEEQLSILESYKKSFIYEYVTGKREVPNE